MREEAIIRMLKTVHQMGQDGVPFDEVLDMIKSAHETTAETS